MIHHYRDLQVWQRAMNVAVEVYELTKSLPATEQYGLTSQIRRCSVSIPSNIAEGHGRSNAEFARFLTIARGSLSELETQLEIALRVGYLDRETLQNTHRELDILGKQLNVLYQRVKNNTTN